MSQSYARIGLAVFFAVTASIWPLDWPAGSTSRYRYCVCAVCAINAIYWAIRAAIYDEAQSRKERP